GLADPAEAEAGDGDAELGERQVGVDVLRHVTRGLGEHMAATRQRLQTRRADLHEGEFGGGEESVQQHETECKQHVQILLKNVVHRRWISGRRRAKILPRVGWDASGDTYPRM